MRLDRFPWKMLLPLLSLMALTACAHSYYYLPEIAGEGATHGKKGGVIYSIPPAAAPVMLTMRVRSLGIHKSRHAQMLGVRMSFARPPGAPKGASGGEDYIDPREQIIRIGGGSQEIRPAYVHSKTKDQSRVVLGGGAHDVVELLYPLPVEGDAARDISSYLFEWKVHYGRGKTERQVARFDRYDASPQQAAELFPEDPDYPYDVSPVGLPGWSISRDPFWWPLDPWWAWQ